MAELPEAEIGARRAIEQVFAADHAKIVAILIGDLGDFDLAEDGLQDAFAEALRTWPTRGVPDRPAAWIVTTARNRAIDRLRRAAVGQDKLNQLGPQANEGDSTLTAILEDDDIPDERLRLVFTSCHPTIDRADAVALTLRTVGGLTTGEVASAFIVKEATMQARITRAKAKIRHASIPYRVPDHHELPDRLPAVLDVVTLIYNQGYTPHADTPLIDSVRNRAIDMAAVLANHLPDEPEALGCHALLLFHEARQPGRVDGDGDLVTLEEQDRSLWNHDLTQLAEPILERALRQGQPGPLQLQAAISALHSTAHTSTETDWSQIVILYDHLITIAPSPTTQIARAIAVGMTSGPAAGLNALPAPDPPLDRFHRWHAAHGELLRRAGDHHDASVAFEKAATLATNPAEQRWLTRAATRSRDTHRIPTR